MRKGGHLLKKAYLFIILGASFWGTISWYVRHLYEFGFTPMEVVILRAWTAAFLLLAYLVIFARQEIKLHAFKDIRYFIGTGIFSIIFFNFCLFTAMQLSTIPVATALLYTAPAFVTILSFLLFKEPLTKSKLISLLLTFVGICLVVGIFPLNIGFVSAKAILFGLGAGLGYSLYSIFSKLALETYSTLSITTFTFITAAIALSPFFPYAEKGALLINPFVLFYALGLGFLPTAFAYIIYTYGLNQTEASKASILTTIEPVVATLIGIFLFQENFTILQFIGMSCILAAVLFIQRSSSNKVHIQQSA